MKIVAYVIMFIIIISNETVADEFIFGAQTHFAQNKGNSELCLTMLQHAGISSIRDEIYWSSVEKENGKLAIPEDLDRVINLALSKHITPLIILSYGNKFYDGGSMPLSSEAQTAFARYAEFIAKHFKGKVFYYEVWNEWNTGFGAKNVPHNFKASPKSYVSLLAKTFTALKKVDPSIKVVGGAIAGWDSSWLEELMKNNAANFMDAISVHPYNYNAGIRGTPENLIKWLDEFHGVLSKYTTTPLPVYITEIGWPTHSGELGVQPEVSANYLGRIFLLAKTRPYIGGVWWYDFQDDGINPNNQEDNFGMIRYDYTPKLSFYVMRDIVSTIKDAEFVERLATDPSFYALKFRKPTGETILTLWSGLPDKTCNVCIKLDEITNKDIFIQQAGNGLPLIRGNTDDTNKVIKFTVSATPLLIHGNINNVVITLACEDHQGKSFFLRR